MTQLQCLHQSPSHFSPTTATTPTAANPSSLHSSPVNNVQRVDGSLKEREKNQRDQLSLLALLFRKSLVACKSERRGLCSMDISSPTNVRHVAHVTFDRFNGFLGLPVEFEPEVPRTPPSASATVFGVSTESMQLSYDTRGNSVPTILLLMQRRLYSQGGLQAEGIFRINGGNSQEDYVRDQLNGGVLPEGVDVHCLAGLIKAWFRELPTGVLDSLQPEGVMQCQTEDECAELVRHLPATESALLDWAINLMADVVEQEYVNRMNARNIAMVFAPNMTQMADPLTALMYAVQVMNFLKTLVTRTLRERQDSVVEPTPASRLGPFHGSGHQSPSLSYSVTREYSETTQSSCNWVQDSSKPDEEDHGELSSSEIAGETDGSVVETEVSDVDDLKLHQLSASQISIGQSSSSNHVKNYDEMTRHQSVLHLAPPQESVGHLISLVGKSREIGNLNRIDSRNARAEAWR